MHTRSLRTAAALALAAALTTGAASTPTSAPGAAHWSPVLARGEASGIVVDADGARLDPNGPPDRTGLLTLPAHTLAGPTDGVDTVIDGDVPAGATAAMDVRGRRGTGGWTEWLPAGPDGTVTLPEPTTQVQGRLLLTGSAAADPVVRAVDLTARPTTSTRITVSARPMLRYKVFATREGLVGGVTANGHVIGEDDYFVALPSRRALAPRGTGDYSVRVCAPAPRTRAAGSRSTAPQRCAFAPVWDVGPWNTRDDYWNPASRRQEWKAVPRGVPQAQVAHLDGFNDGRDQYDREVLNPAGIDLSDALFRDGVGLRDNGWVTVDYLWTGDTPLATVASADGAVQIRSAPSGKAPVVGLAGDEAGVPAGCVADRGNGAWLKIGDGQFVPVGATRLPAKVRTCAGGDYTVPAGQPAGPDPVIRPDAASGDRPSPRSVRDEVGAELEAARAEVEAARRAAGLGASD